MSLDKLRQLCSKEWPSIAKAHVDSAKRLQQLQQIVSKDSIDSDDISVVVFGSLARREWTSGSDLDWTLLVDGGADQGHAYTAGLFRNKLEEAGLKQPGTTGTFGALTFSHDLIHLIGGENDTNRNTTQRMLLLLESRPAHLDAAYNRVVAGVLNRYLENDFREFRLKVPRFLQNDLHRFWRTMCVDYANKYRERAGKGWATRIVKLRMSRKLIFAAGLLSCFSCDPALVQRLGQELATKPSVEAQVEFLRTFVKRTPLDIVAEVLWRNKSLSTAALILDAYDRFLELLDDAKRRKELDDLPPNGGGENATFEELIQCSRNLEKGLQQLFFDDDPLLASLTRKYGIF